VSESCRVDHDASDVRVPRDGADSLDEGSFLVALKEDHVEVESLAEWLQFRFELGQGGSAIDLGLPAAELVEVGAVDDEYPGHLADDGKIVVLKRSNALRRSLLLVLVAGVLACGDAPFGDVGGGASDWIGEPTLVSTATTEADGPALVPVRRVDWFNGDLPPVAGTTSAEIISGVYARAQPSDPFVQATPAEIALALPGIEFPSQVPPEVRYVTSQLVYDLAQISLSSEQVAAFGLWSVEPYTRSRSVGQQAVLTVINDPEGLAALASGTADTSCARFIDRQAACSVTSVEGSPAWELTDRLGVSLIWYSATYRYELFLRSGVNSGWAVPMADSARPLDSVSS